MASVTLGPDPTDVVGRRVAAWLLDGLITYAGFAFVLYAFGLSKSPSVRSGTEYNNWLLGIFLTEIVYFIGVFILRGVLVGTFGWSPGKLMLGLRVVNWDGRPPGLAKGFIRSFVDTFGQGILGCIYDIPALFFAMNTVGHRQPADMAAQTYVVDSYYLGRLIVRRTERTAAGPPSVKREEMEQLLRDSGVPANFIPPNSKITEPFYEKSMGTYVVYNVKREAWLKFDKATKTWDPIADDNAAITPETSSGRFPLGPGSGAGAD
jgi:uncharacterized RDD family membrane protein YckC